MQTLNIAGMTIKVWDSVEGQHLATALRKAADGNDTSLLHCDVRASTFGVEVQQELPMSVWDCDDTEGMTESRVIAPETALTLADLIEAFTIRA